MAVVLTAAAPRYIGLSTDTKPATPPVGSTLYETDSGLTYVYASAAWTALPDVGGFLTARHRYSFAVDGGATGAFTIFTITGNVMAAFFAICNTALTGATATIELGVTGNTAVLIPQTTATALIADEIWFDATPTTTVEQIDVLGARMFVVANGQDAIMTVATAALTAGIIDFYALWRPLSTTGLVVG